MPRRNIISLVVIILACLSLAATAAVFSASVPARNVTPQIHREGDEGYFSIKLPLPQNAPPGYLGLNVTVESGDCRLVTARMPYPGQPAEVDEDEETLTSAGKEPRQFTVTGRYSRPGPVRLVVRARAANDSFKPLLKLSFSLPGEAIDNPEVRRNWAEQQQYAIASADPRGEDSFSQYWNIVIAPRYGLSPNLHEASSRFRRDPPDLYSVFTGAAAIQESLQLELLGSGPQNPSQRESIANAAKNGRGDVPITSLSGPAIKSHPFKEMLKERTPQLPSLAAVIPADQYAVFFANISKQIELTDLMDEWGGNLLHQAQAEARDFKVRGKISRQLCLEDSLLTRLFGDRVITEMAYTGNDPFLKEGTAFTVLFSLKDQSRFRKQLEKRYAAAAEQGAVRSAFASNGMTGMSVVSADRSISSHTLIMGDTAVVSTSLIALERVVATKSGRLTSLAQSDDFRYMRTVFPQNAGEEDIFIYLSDPHIRTLVGPRWKIGEARRMRCSATMAMIANARLWFRAEQGREPTMAELVSGGYLGSAGPDCPDHGSYSIDREGRPYCSLHNRPGLLTPVGDVPLERVSTQEAAQYKAFMENYNRYWTQFFDPIGIRVKMGKDIRIQTCILPLIENSWYDGLAAFSGRSPGLLSESALLPRTILSLRGHVSPQWLEKSILERYLARSGGPRLDWLGDELAINLCDGQVLFSAGGSAMGLMGQQMGRSSLEPIIIGYLGSALNLPTYLTMKVTDPRKAEQAIPAIFRSLVGDHGSRDELSVETYGIEDHRGKPVYVASFNLWVLKLRLFAAVVDDRLVIASRRDIITDLLDASGSGAGRKVVTQKGNMELSVYRSAFRQLEETVNLGWQEDLRHACQQNLPLASLLLTTLGLPPESLGGTVAGLRGYQPYCPSGGRYLLDEKTGNVVCSVHGSRWQPKQPAAGDQSSKTLKLVNSLDRVNARLAFTPEGLMTTVDIRRK